MGIENVLYKIDILSYIDCLSSFIKRYIICNVCKRKGLLRSWWEGLERHIQFPIVEHHSQLKALPVAVALGFYSQQPDLAVQCFRISV
ncbi:Uncharacterised protein [Shigella sonnei]|nr:Uncharacterised protein [Shigella sonnei]